MSEFPQSRAQFQGSYLLADVEILCQPQPTQFAIQTRLIVAHLHQAIFKIFYSAFNLGRDVVQEAVQ
jgi:hypothetical protein